MGQGGEVLTCHPNCQWQSHVSTDIRNMCWHNANSQYATWASSSATEDSGTISPRQHDNCSHEPLQATTVTTPERAKQSNAHLTICTTGLNRTSVRLQLSSGMPRQHHVGARPSRTPAAKCPMWGTFYPWQRGLQHMGRNTNTCVAAWGAARKPGGKGDYTNRKPR